jgi:hypothetical protein
MVHAIPSRPRTSAAAAAAAVSSAAGPAAGVLAGARPPTPAEERRERVERVERVERPPVLGGAEIPDGLDFTADLMVDMGEALHAGE